MGCRTPDFPLAQAKVPDRSFITAFEEHPNLLEVPAEADLTRLAGVEVRKLVRSGVEGIPPQVSTSRLHPPSIKSCCIWSRNRRRRHENLFP